MKFPILKKKKLILAAISIAVMAAALAWKIKWDGNQLEVSFYHVESDKILNGFRIVQLSDLHLKEFGEKNRELVERIGKLKPDIIAVTGDMNMVRNDDYHVVLELCGQLTQIADVYYVMGNHEFVDFADRKTEIAKDIEGTGVHLLTNASEKTTVNGSLIEIGGLVNETANYEKRGGKKFMDKFMEDPCFKLLLVHYPEYFLDGIEGLPIDLALCGHTHGGVIRIPFIGGLYAGEQGIFPELTEGMHELGNSTVIVSRGLGNSHKIPRINNKPELVVVDVNWY